MPYSTPTQPAFLRAVFWRILAALLLACMGVAYAKPAISQPPAENWFKTAPDGCWAYFWPAPKPGFQATWSGACVDGKAEGEGEFVWSEEGQEPQRYIGQVKAGQQYGYGKQISNDVVADGQWVWDDFTGPGQLQTDTCRIKGNFVDMHTFGQAEIRCEDGHSYVGNTRYTKLWGFATATLAGDSPVELVGVGRVATAKQKGIGRAIGKGFYQVTGWWEYGALRHACNSAKRCEAWAKKDDQRQAKLVAALTKKGQHQPYLTINGTTRYTWYAPNGTLLHQGVSNAAGHASVVPAPSGNDAATSTIYVIELWSGHYSLEVRPECWKRVAQQFEQCANIIQVDPPKPPEYLQEAANTH